MVCFSFPFSCWVNNKDYLFFKNDKPFHLWISKQVASLFGQHNMYPHISLVNHETLSCYRDLSFHTTNKMKSVAVVLCLVLAVNAIPSMKWYQIQPLKDARLTDDNIQTHWESFKQTHCKLPVFLFYVH